MEFKFARARYRIADKIQAPKKPHLYHYLIEKITNDNYQPVYRFNKRPLNAGLTDKASGDKFENFSKYDKFEQLNTTLEQAMEGFHTAISGLRQIKAVDIDGVELGDNQEIEGLFRNLSEGEIVRDQSGANESGEPFMGNWHQNKKASTAWTQSQVYSDGNNIYDIGLLIDTVAHNQVRNIKIKDYKCRLFDKTVWGTKERPLSPMDVINNPTFNKDNVKHMQKIRTADMSKPILIRLETGLIVDGYHRLSRAFLQGDERISAKYVAEEQMRNAIFE